MNDGRESERRATVPAAAPSPTDVQEVVELLRRWTRLPSDQRPKLRMVYRGIGQVSELGYLEWATAALGHRAYARLRQEHPVEAMLFRAELEALCRRRAEFLSHMRGAAPVSAFGCALAEHARAFPGRVLGDDDPAA